MAGAEDDEEGTAETVGTGRLLAFSDGVFAIAFTILVLDLGVPENLSAAALRAAVDDQLPHLLSALLSFAVIGRFWIAHHGLFTHVRAADGPLLVLNTVLMAMVAMIPFGAGLLAEYSKDPIAVIIYTLIVAAAALAQLGVWLWVTHERRLVHDRIDDLAVLTLTLGLSGAALAFLVGAPVALLSTTAAQLCWLIALVPTGRLAARLHARTFRPS